MFQAKIQQNKTQYIERELSEDMDVTFENIY